MLAKASIYPDAPVADMAIVFLVVACVLAALFVMDWVRN
jgi:hypothetical protein